MKPSKTPANVGTTETPAVSTGHARPEFFRLPARGPDPIFGLSRSFYYAAEKAGKLRMVRLRKPGNLRGVVLVPVPAVANFIRENGSWEDAQHPVRVA